jgi:hypothetical protein
MSAQPVDVLAVMDAEIDALNWREMREARAAVAELIEAATVIGGTLNSDSAVLAAGLGTSAVLPYRKLRAALSRCTGGQ